MGANKIGYVTKIKRPRRTPGEAPSIMEHVAISFTGVAPPNVQARVLEESRANQAYLAGLRNGHW